MRKFATVISALVLVIAMTPLFAAAPLVKTSAQVDEETLNLTIAVTEDERLGLDLFEFINFAHRGGHQYHRGDYRPHYYQNNRNQSNRYRFTPRRSNTEYYGDRAIDESEFAEFASRKATGNKVFIFDPRRLKWYAYSRSGNLVASGRASGGAHYCRDVRRACRTPVGTFSVYHKGSAYCKSSKYPIGRGGAPMPHCMFFKKGYAIHGSPDVPGRNASHGCIRVLPGAARWLHRDFIDHGTTVIVRPY